MIRLARHLLPLAGDRLACAVHLFGLAMMLSAANVVLGTIASALFLAERGPDELPLLYLALAALSIPLASALSTGIDRWSRIRIFQGLMLGLAAVAVALWLLAPLRAPAVPYAIYLTSHTLDIVGQLVFWLLVSEYFTTRDLKRSTVALAMGLAAGGVLGGGAAMLLATALDASDLLLLLPPLCLAMIGQVVWLDRSLEPIGAGPSGLEGGPDAAPGLLDSLRRLPVLVLRYRLALLTGASVLLVTVLYCFQEYLVFTVYAAAFPEAAELTRFLAALYAGLQLVEVILLYALSRPLITFSGPVLRNAIFPLTTLASLGWLGLTFQLPAVVLSHSNSDAVSNAIYEPVRTLNFAALPLRILGRVRTVADAMIYPAGIALGGLLLLLLQAHLTLRGIAVAALLCALALLAVRKARASKATSRRRITPACRARCSRSRSSQRSAWTTPRRARRGSTSRSGPLTCRAGRREPRRGQGGAREGHVAHPGRPPAGTRGERADQLLRARDAHRPHRDRSEGARFRLFLRRLRSRLSGLRPRARAKPACGVCAGSAFIRLHSSAPAVHAAETQHDRRLLEAG